jgi:hypothetical protein
MTLKFIDEIFLLTLKSKTSTSTFKLESLVGKPVEHVCQAWGEPLCRLGQLFLEELQWSAVPIVGHARLVGGWLVGG